MDKHFELIPEDGAIQALLRILGYSKTVLGDGIGNTMNKLIKQYHNKFAVALIDDDKIKPKHVDLFTKLLEDAVNLQLWQKPECRHFIILIKPAIDDWLLSQATICEIDPSKFGFSNLEGLKRVTKNPLDVNKNPAFQQFLHHLNQKKAPGFIQTQEWIEQLYDKYL